MWTTKVNEIIRGVYAKAVHKSGTYKAYLGKVRLVSQKVLNREILVDIAVFDKATVDGLSGTCIIRSIRGMVNYPDQEALSLRSPACALHATHPTLM